jgi:murein DD-endopeptidase MepM/ murein hydrolase activator NlpD
MFRRSLQSCARFLCAAIAVLAVAIVVTSAPAHTRPQSGGASMPERPVLAEARCADGKLACAEGAVLKLKGEYLETTRTVVFLGGKGPKDDRRVTPTSHTLHRVLVRVPAGAPSGRLRVIAELGGASPVGPRIRVIAPAVPAPPPSTATQGPIGADGIFPIDGRYQWGTATNHFGGGRNHQGEDVFAKCGTPLVAAVSGQVTLAKWHDRAGNYLVVKAADGTSQVYMHMRDPATVRRGQQIAAGTPIGFVGDTGRAEGCHLHFELWTAPGYYAGGEAIDPLPTLKRWAKASAARARP